MIPNSLEEWSLEKINELIEKGVSESDIHDFKMDLPDAETLTKLCCAFANSKGGYIILGIKENGSKFEICGIKNDKDLSHKFGQKINANPTIQFNLPKILNLSNDLVIAIFEIPFSVNGPHLPDNSPSKRLFQKRTNKGNDYMTYDEIRLSFQNYQEKREKIKLMYLELISNIQQLDLMLISSEDISTKYSLVTLDDTIINGLLVEVYSLISKNKILIEKLFQIRNHIKNINNAIKIFYTKVGLPLSNQTSIVENHNNFITSKVAYLKPLLEDAAKIISNEFNLDNPF